MCACVPLYYLVISILLWFDLVLALVQPVEFAMPQVGTVLHQMSPPAVRCWMRLMKPDNGSGPCGFWCPGDIHRHRSAPRNPGPGLSFGIIWVYLEMGSGETYHLMVDCWLIIISPILPFWILGFPQSWAKRDLFGFARPRIKCWSRSCPDQTWRP